MKKNEQLFDIMGDIPEEYVEDALNDNAVTEKKISVKRVAGTIAACAAAFAAVAAVPVLMMYVNGKAGNGNDQLPVTSDTVAETTENGTEDGSVDNTEDQNEADENQQNSQLSFGTGPKRPENYTPDRKYSSCLVDDSTLSSEEKEKLLASGENYLSTYLKTILVNESFADEIVSDYQSETEEYLKSRGLNEGDYILSYYINCPDYGACMNGYIEIDASIFIYESGENKIIGYVYDLVEEKKLDNNSDLFYYGEDYIDQIMTALHGENYDPEYSKPERITMTDMIMSKENGNTADICGMSDWMYDISVTGRYRDLSGVIKDEYIHEDEYEEWYSSFPEIHVDDYTIRTAFMKSRFHSESEINEIKNLRINRCTKVLDYLKNNHYLDECSDKWLSIMFGSDDSVINVYERERNECLAGGLKYDTEKEAVLPADDDIPEWRNYIKGYFANDDEHYEHLITDFDPEKFDCLDYRWANWYYISEYSLNWANVPDNDYSIVLSDEEIENLDDAAFLLKIYDHETQEKHSVLVVMPFEKISDPELTKENFMGEPYSEHVRYWDK
ncbi:MAG: hypothetical protein IJL67_07505 [Oscillospiraceae bacterium]|nr:hypothetical protein [Oscillospiraceae bacterium]